MYDSVSKHSRRLGDGCIFNDAINISLVSDYVVLSVSCTVCLRLSYQHFVGIYNVLGTDNTLETHEIGNVVD